MLGLALSLCTVACTTHPQSHFPIGIDHQMEIFETWKNICISESRETTQFSSYPMDLERLGDTATDARSIVLAIDVGGSFLKANVVEVCPTTLGSCRFNVLSGEKYPYETVDADGMVIGDMLWNEWVASRVRDFVSQHCPSDCPRLASLTFSYPLDQRSVSSGHIKLITKNWVFRRDKDLYQSDVAESLNSSLRKRNLGTVVTSVSNDVVSTFMCGRAKGHHNSIAVVMGTGTNAGFVLKCGKANPNDTQKGVLVNSEWASCPIPKCICTDADRAAMAARSQMYSEERMLELLVAGVGFVDIVKSTAKAKDQAFFSDESEKAVLEEINRVFYAGSCLDGWRDNYLYSIVRDFKIRSYRMVAPLIVASMSLADSMHFTIIVNGSCLQNQKDREMLEDEIKAFLQTKGLGHTCSIKHYDDASLLGSAYLAVTSQDLE